MVSIGVYLDYTWFQKFDEMVCGADKFEVIISYKPEFRKRLNKWFLVLLLFCKYPDFFTSACSRPSGCVLKDTYVLISLRLIVSWRVRFRAQSTLLVSSFLSSWKVWVCCQQAKHRCVKTYLLCRDFLLKYVDSVRVLKFARHLVIPWHTLPSCVWTGTSL